MRIVLYQPDIPQNLGAILRSCACFGVDVDIIEPCGFPLDDKKIRRAGMDYIDHVIYHKHASWEHFLSYTKNNRPGRLLLLTTKGATYHDKIVYQETDYLILGRESAGVPDSVHNIVDERVIIPINKEVRSMNVVVAGTIVLAEALRQTNGFPY